jgi:protein-disulfide isomerase
MKKRLLAVSMIALMLTAVGCSNPSTDKEEVKKKTEITVEQQENTVNKLDFENLFPNEEIRAYAEKMIGTKAPDFTFKNLKGEEVQLSKLKGQNVIVEIASTTCSACIEAFPQVDVFKDMSGEQVKVLTVFPNESKADVEKFFEINKYERDETVIAGEGMNNMISDYQVQYTPTFIFVDKEGYIQFVHVGGDVNEVVMSSMSDLAFKTTLSDTFNSEVEVELEVPEDMVTPKENTTSDKK